MTHTIYTYVQVDISVLVRASSLKFKILLANTLLCVKCSVILNCRLR